MKLMVRVVAVAVRMADRPQQVGCLTRWVQDLPDGPIV
jgi:hypothetical protein